MFGLPDCIFYALSFPECVSPSRDPTVVKWIRYDSLALSDKKKKGLLGDSTLEYFVTVVSFRVHIDAVYNASFYSRLRTVRNKYPWSWHWTTFTLLGLTPHSCFLLLFLDACRTSPKAHAPLLYFQHPLRQRECMAQSMLPLTCKTQLYM